MNRTSSLELNRHEIQQRTPEGWLERLRQGACISRRCNNRIRVRASDVSN